jgi:hypothetical protein
VTLERLRRAAVPALVLVLAVVLALLAWALLAVLDPRPWVALLGACGPLIVPGGPAALMLWAALRHCDPYDVSHRYPSEGRGSVGPRE